MSVFRVSLSGITFGYQVSGVKFRVMPLDEVSAREKVAIERPRHFGFRVSCSLLGIMLRVSGFGFRVSGIVLAVGYHASGFGFRVSGIEFRAIPLEEIGAREEDAVERPRDDSVRLQ